MTYQYDASLRRKRGLAVGEIIYLQDGLRPFGPATSFRPVRRNPYMIESFRPRHCAITNSYHARDGHLVTMRSLRTGQRVDVADWSVRMSEELAA